MQYKEIGGYFGLELVKGQEYHKGAIRLNSGRNCFKYILIAQRPLKVYLPYYMDNALKEEKILDLGIPFEYYHINSNFEISNKLNVRKGEKLLYINYFGLKDEYVNNLVSQYGDRMIVDNTQAFF